MKKTCDLCGNLINDGDTVVVACLTVYHELPSRVAYAIDQPHECLDVIHYACRNKEAPNEPTN